MADLQRLIRSALWFVVGVLIAVVPVLSYAQTLVEVYEVWRPNYSDSVTGTPSYALSNSNQYMVGQWVGTDPALVIPRLTPVPSVVVAGYIYTCGALELRPSAGYSYRQLCTNSTGSTVYMSFAMRTRSGTPPECDSGETRNLETGECVSPPPPECGPNSTLNGAGDRCFCNRGYQTPEGGASYLATEGGSCVSYCAETVGKNSIFTTTNTSSGVCMMGCWYNRESVVGGSNCSLSLDISADANTPSTYRCSMAGTGQHCDSYGQGESSEPPAPEPEPPPPEPEPEPEPCKAGFQTVTVNGMNSCVKSPPPVDNVDEGQKTVTNPDGTTTTTSKTTTTKVNGDGTVTKTTNTETTTKDQDGNTVSNGGGSTSSTQSLNGFCEENPTSPICGNQPGLFAGDCYEESKCEGDALQCAIAAATFKTQCALSATDEIKDAFQEMIDFEGTGEGEGLDRLEINVNELQVSMAGGGAGLADQSFSVMGKTIVLPFSKLNSILAFIGYAVMAIAWLQAYKIIREAF